MFLSFQPFVKSETYQVATSLCIFVLEELCLGWTTFMCVLHPQNVLPSPISLLSGWEEIIMLVICIWWNCLGNRIIAKRLSWNLSSASEDIFKMDFWGGKIKEEDGEYSIAEWIPVIGNGGMTHSLAIPFVRKTT